MAADNLALRLDDQATGGWLLGVLYQLADRDGKLVRRYQLPRQPAERAKFLCVQEFLPIEEQVPGDSSPFFLEGVEVKSLSQKDYRVRLHFPEPVNNPIFKRYQFVNQFSNQWHPFFDTGITCNLREYLKVDHPGPSVTPDKKVTNLGRVLLSLTNQVDFTPFFPFLINRPKRYVDLITTKGDSTQGYVTTGVRVNAKDHSRLQFSLRVVNSHVTRESTDLWFHFENDPLTKKELSGMTVKEGCAKFVFPTGLYPDEVIARLCTITQSLRITPTRKGFSVSSIYKRETFKLSLTTFFIIHSAIREKKAFTPLSLEQYQFFFGGILKGLDESSFEEVWSKSNLKTYQDILNLINLFLEKFDLQVLVSAAELVDYSSCDSLIKMVENCEKSLDREYLPIVTCAQYGFMPLFHYIAEREGYTFSLQGEEMEEWEDWEVVMPCLRAALENGQTEVIEYLFTQGGERVVTLMFEERIGDVRMLYPQKTVPVLMKLIRQYDSEQSTVPISIENLAGGLTPELIEEYKDFLEGTIERFIDYTNSEVLDAKEVAMQFARLIPDSIVKEIFEFGRNGKVVREYADKEMSTVLKKTHPHLFKK